MRRWALLVVLCAGCAGDPFEMAEAGALTLDEGVDAGVDASALDGSTLSRDAPAAGDVATEVAPPTSGDAAGDDARTRTDAPAPGEGAADASPAVDSSPVDSAPSPLCCDGAGQVSCSAQVQCYGPSSSCSAHNVDAPDGGQYQTFACSGPSSSCSAGCLAGSPCLWPGPEPGQWLGGMIGACR